MSRGSQVFPEGGWVIFRADIDGDPVPGRPRLRWAGVPCLALFRWAFASERDVRIVVPEIEIGVHLCSARLGAWVRGKKRKEKGLQQLSIL